MLTKDHILKYRIIESIKLLASEGEQQLSCFPDFVCKGDEIVTSLDSWIFAYQNPKAGFEYTFNLEEWEMILDLNKDVCSVPVEELSDDAICNSKKWRNIRKEARQLLVALGVEYTFPDISSV